jgi:hypothetical protein
MRFGVDSVAIVRMSSYIARVFVSFTLDWMFYIHAFTLMFLHSLLRVRLSTAGHLCGTQAGGTTWLLLNC